MGRIGRLLKFTRLTRNDVQTADVEIGLGGNLVITAEHAEGSGSESRPLPGDAVVISGVQGTGRNVAIAYIDEKQQPVTLPGEKRIYARDEDTGELVAEVRVHNTGAVRIANGNGAVVLAANGDVTINGVIITAGGDILGVGTMFADTLAGSTSVLAGGKELNGHIHNTSSPGAPTGPNT